MFRTFRLVDFCFLGLLGLGSFDFGAFGFRKF